MLALRVRALLLILSPYHAYEPLSVLEEKYAEADSKTSSADILLKPSLKKPASDATEFAQVLEHVYREYKQQNSKISPADLLLSLRASPSFRRMKDISEHSLGASESVRTCW